MQKRLWLGMVCSSLIGFQGIVAAGEAARTASTSSKEFERIKQLAGRWEGMTRHGEGKEELAVVEYKVTSGGSAVVETLFPGTPHEMVSVYHTDGQGKLSMTHYCMIGNQPKLDLTQSDDNHVELSLASDSGIAPEAMHMHSLNVTWQDADHLTQQWSSFDGGKPKETTTIRLSRARSS